MLTAQYQREEPVRIQRPSALEDARAAAVAEREQAQKPAAPEYRDDGSVRAVGHRAVAAYLSGRGAVQVGGAP